MVTVAAVASLVTLAAALATGTATSLQLPTNNVTCCVGWPVPVKGKDHASQKEACEVAGDAKDDGGTYHYNKGRGTADAICGQYLECDCCRTGPVVKGLCHGGSGPAPAPAPTPGDPAAVNVFHEKLGNISCYRIPSIVQTDKGVLVAFAEARVGSCGDGSVHSIAVRRSSDNGATWDNVTFVRGPKDSMVGNPTAIYTKSGKIVLIYVLHTPKCEADCGSGNGVSISSGT